MAQVSQCCQCSIGPSTSTAGFFRCADVGGKPLRTRRWGLVPKPSRLRCKAALPFPDPDSGGNALPFRINRNRIQGPDPHQQLPLEQTPIGDMLMGEQEFANWSEARRSERQRVWNSMRAAAQDRYAKGQMPDWFEPRWLLQEEAPVNAIMREMGAYAYQNDDTWIGRPYDADARDLPAASPEQLALEGGDGGGDDDDWANGGGGPGGRGGDGPSPGGGWWREDDPYWMLRDWGDHPMRWWTLAYAAALAGGAVLAYVWHGSIESLLLGSASAAWLALCSLALSDMRNEWFGEMGVKMAFGVCALLALKDGLWGWNHLPDSGSQRLNYNRPFSFLRTQEEPAPWDWLFVRFPKLHFSPAGWASVGMCCMYIWTGMGGIIDKSLPTNPGAVYKTADVAAKHRVWERWGYGDATMRV